MRPMPGPSTTLPPRPWCGVRPPSLALRLLAAVLAVLAAAPSSAQDVQGGSRPRPGASTRAGAPSATAAARLRSELAARHYRPATPPAVATVPRGLSAAAILEPPAEQPRGVTGTHVVAFQPDADHRRPMAAVGDSVRVLLDPATGSTAIVRVLARSAYRPAADACGLRVSAGWGYLLDLTPDRAADALAAATAVAVPVNAAVRGIDTVPATAKEAFRPAYAVLRDSVYQAAVARYRGQHTPAALKAQIWGELGVDWWTEQRVYGIQTSAGRRSLAIIEFQDDPTDHGGTTRRIILAEGGRILASRATLADPIALADLDGDGSEDLITRSGVVGVTISALDVSRLVEPIACD